MAGEAAAVGEGDGTGNDGADGGGALPPAVTEATGADEVGAAGDDAEVAEATEPVAKGDGAAGDEPGVRGPGGASAVVVWLPLAASAI